MKTRTATIYATYWGNHPIQHENQFGNRKYVGYDYVFGQTNTILDGGGWAGYTLVRAKKVPAGLEIGKRYEFRGTFCSGIFAKLEVVGRITNPTEKELTPPPLEDRYCEDLQLPLPPDIPASPRCTNHFDPCLSFGKYKGKRISEVAELNISYLIFISGFESLSATTKRAIKRAIDKNARKTK